jgi:hypothetical protein
MFSRQPSPGQAEDKAAKKVADPAVAVLDQEIVTVHAANDAAVSGNATTRSLSPAQAPEVFAEIWKDGMRVGRVYTNGQAELANALGGSSFGASGAMYAQMRAEQISQEVGGEVRYTNLDALKLAQTRDQLRSAYGA